MARKELQLYLNTAIDAVTTMKPLPLIHVTRLGDFHHKINGNNLEPRPNKVGESITDIICFFYGRAAYIPDKGKNVHIALKQWQPVCIGIDSRYVPISDMYPFDTGAYTNDLVGQDGMQGFRSYHFPTFTNNEIGLFSLSDSLSVLKNYIHTIFGSNDAYMKSKTNFDFSVISPLDDDVLYCLLTMIADKTPGSKIDNRVECIEVQSKTPIQISPDNQGILFICCPNHAMHYYMDSYNVIPYDDDLDKSENLPTEFVRRASDILKNHVLGAST